MGITVRELTKECMALIRNGYGDKTILISGDDEGNEFHTLFYLFTTSIEDIKAYADMDMFHDKNNPNEVVILG